MYQKYETITAKLVKISQQGRGYSSNLSLQISIKVTANENASNKQSCRIKKANYIE